MKKTSFALLLITIAILILVLAIVGYQLKPSYYKNLCESNNGTWDEFEYKGYNTYCCYIPQKGE